LATALLLFGSAVYFGLERLLNQQLNESLVRQARTIGDEVLVDFAKKGSHYAVTEIDESYEPAVNARFIRVTREGGGFGYRSPSPHDASFDSAKIADVVGDDRSGYAPSLIAGDGRPMVIQGLRYETPDGNAFLIETGAPYQLIAAQLRSARLAMILGIPVFLLAAAAGGLVLVRKSLQPLIEITEQAERISSTNISERLPVARTGDEVERLSLSLNRMIERLEESFQHISRFSADVAHESFHVWMWDRQELNESQ
jgi:methyl-accepting chemotaxis protein